MIRSLYHGRCLYTISLLALSRRWESMRAKAKVLSAPERFEALAGLLVILTTVIYLIVGILW